MIQTQGARFPGGRARNAWLWLVVLVWGVQSVCGGGRVGPGAEERWNVEGALVPPHKIKALLVAGSKDWWNYRHQSSVYRMYQMLHYGEVPDNNIIMMHYDDIAENEHNPFPGKVFERLDGPDMYDRTWADYRGEAVTSRNFFAALQGKKEDVLVYGDGVSSKRVLESTEEDTVIVFFAGYGAPGILAMPNYPADNIFADELNAALVRMVRKEVPATFGRMLLIVDAPHAGSMFDGLLPPQAPVLALTASDRSTVNYGIHCDDPRFAAGSPCVTEAFTDSLLDVLRTIDLTTATVDDWWRFAKETSFANVHAHASRYGLDHVGTQRLSSFFGSRRATDRYMLREARPLLQAAKQSHSGRLQAIENELRHALDHGLACSAYDTKLCYLRSRAKKLGGTADHYHASQAPQWEGVAEKPVPTEKAQAVEAQWEAFLRWRRDFNGRFDEVLKRMVNRFMHFSEVKEAAVKSGVVKDWSCYKNMLRMMSNMCEWGDNPCLIERFSSLATLCEVGRTPSDLAGAAEEVCCPTCLYPPAPYQMPQRGLNEPADNDPEFQKLIAGIDLAPIGVKQHERMFFKKGKDVGRVKLDKKRHGHFK